MRTGLIVAGGRSTRMGDRDKAVVELAGTPLIRHVADRLSETVDTLVVNCRNEQRAAIAGALSGLDVAFAIDEETDRGPVGGIERGLREADTEYTAVASCDLPFLDPGQFAYLFECAAGRDAAVPRPEEWFEPLHAVYRTEPTRRACKEVLAAGDPRVIAPLEHLDHVVVDRTELLEYGSLESFEGVDTPEALAWAEKFI